MFFTGRPGSIKLDMAAGWTLLFQRLLSVAVFQSIRLFFVAVQRIYWELNGTARQLRRATDPLYYEQSAQVLDVVMERCFCEMQNHCYQDFICVHNRFENPQYVIDNEHVTLYTITDRNAIFSVAGDRGMIVVGFYTDLTSVSIRNSRPILTV